MQIKRPSWQQRVTRIMAYHRKNIGGNGGVSAHQAAGVAARNKRGKSVYNIQRVSAASRAARRGSIKTA